MEWWCIGVDAKYCPQRDFMLRLSSFVLLLSAKRLVVPVIFAFSSVAVGNNCPEKSIANKQNNVFRTTSSCTRLSIICAAAQAPFQGLVFRLLLSCIVCIYLHFGRILSIFE